MPMYEYRCDECGSKYEVLHIGRENTEDVVCPKCRSTQHHKLMSATNMNMSGSGSSGDPAPSCGSGCCGGSCGLD